MAGSVTLITAFAAMYLLIACDVPRVIGQASGEDEGLLELHLRGDPRIQYRVADFTVKTVTPAGLSPDCHVLIFNDLTDVRVPDGTTELSEPVPLSPIKSTPPNADGSLFLYLPEGRYSVMERGCFLVQAPLGALNPSVLGNPCCPRIEANPAFQTIETESGDDVYHVQTVDVRRGKTTRVSLVGLPEKTLSRLQLAAIVIGLVAAIVVFIIAPIVLVSQWWTRRARRRPVVAKSLEIDGSATPPATFEDVFGDAVRERYASEEPRSGSNRHSKDR